MGEVYRASDSRLSRDVAIKVLPQEVADDPERLARFRREAQVLASLNHPNVGAIYGLEEANGKPFLVLELVEGQTLAERLERGPLPIPEALEIAWQIADGLSAAHDKTRSPVTIEYVLMPTADAQRFVVVETMGEDVAMPLTVTLGWQALFRK